MAKINRKRPMCLDNKDEVSWIVISVDRRMLAHKSCSSCLVVGFGGLWCGLRLGFFCDSIFRIWSWEHLYKAAHGDV